MGRTNGKLIPFLKQGLQYKLYVNLNYEDAEIFYLEFPRFDEKKRNGFEMHGKIFRDWCKAGGKKYENYSNGKSVLQAALKKSVYLMKLPIIGKRLRYRFASADEVKENRRLQKLRANASRDALNAVPESPVNISYSDASSPASSGYHSGGEDEDHQVVNDTTAQPIDDLDSLLSDADLLSTDSVDDSMLIDFFAENIMEDDLSTPKTEGENIIGNLQPQDNFMADALQPSSQPISEIDISSILNQMQSILLPQHVNNSVVEELSLTPVDTTKILKKKFWLCTQKVKVGRTLLIICDKQAIEHDDQGMMEGKVMIPNDVWEPGVQYSFKQAVEVDGKKFCFFSPDSA